MESDTSFELSDSDDSWEEEGNEVLKILSNKKTASSDISKQRKQRNGSDLLKPKDFDLGFSLKVQKPQLPVGFNKDRKTNERTKFLSEVIKKDEAEALAEMKSKLNIRSIVKSQLSSTALKNEKYVDYITKNYNDEEKLSKDVRFLSRPPGPGILKENCSLQLGSRESYLVTDLKVMKNAFKINRSSDISKFQVTRTNDYKMIRTVASLADPFFVTNMERKDDIRLPVTLDSFDFEAFLKELGFDLHFLRDASYYDLSELRSLNKFEDIVSVALSLQKLSIGMNVFIDNLRVSYLERIKNTSRFSAQRMIDITNAESHLLPLLKVSIMLLTDATLHENLDSSNYHGLKVKSTACHIFDRLIQAYAEILSLECDENNRSVDATVFTKLRDKVKGLLYDLTHSKEILRKPLCCLMQADLSNWTKVLVYYLTYEVIIDCSKEEEQILSEDERSTSMLQYLPATSAERHAVVIHQLCSYFEKIRFRSLRSANTNYRGNVTLFIELRARFILIEKLIVSNINSFPRLHYTNDKIYDHSANHIENNTFKLDRRSIIAHLLSTYLSQLKLNYFRNFDLSANPVLGKVMNLIGNLIFRLEKELEMNVMDLET